MHQLSK